MNLGRREFLELVGRTAAAAALSHVSFSTKTWAEEPASAPVDRPNIVFILADDMGYGDISCQGGSVPTPHIDSIGNDGVRFTSGYVTAPVCTPTRAGFMTGRYQQRFGFHALPGLPEWASPNFVFPTGEKMIAEYLKERGYATAIMGKWHLGYDAVSHPMERGFDEFYGILSGARMYVPGDKSQRGRLYRGKELTKEPEYLTDAIGQESVAFIEKNKDRPFFLYASFTAVHTPLQATEKYLSRFAGIKEEKKRVYAAMLSALDDAIGAILDALKANQLDEKTLVVFLSDNGGYTMRQTPANNAPFKGSKASLHEGGIRVPFMIKWKDSIPPHQICDEPVISLDLLPTILSATHTAATHPASVPAAIDGIDLLPLLQGDQQKLPARDLFWLYEDQWAIRSGDWKLIRSEKTQQPSLYNLAADQSESMDLAKDNPKTVEELTEKFEQWARALPPPKYRYNELKPAGAKGGDE